MVDELVAGAEPGVVALGSGRYFGFVIGGALPAALAADWLTSTWDQNAGIYPVGPSASVVEQVTRDWLVDLLGLPGEASVGFVTGTQLAHVTGLAAARWHVLDAGRLGRRPRRASRARRRFVSSSASSATSPSTGRCGCSDSAHPRSSPPTTRAGCGRTRWLEALAEGTGPTIVCAQAGDVNTGAFDPLARDRRRLRERESLAPRGRRLRHLGRGLAALPPPRRRPGARRLVDDRRAQVAPGALRLRPRLLRSSRVPPGGDDGDRLVPDPGRGRTASAGRGRLGARVLASRARVRGLRGAALARPQRPRRARRALLRRRRAFRRADRRGRGRGGPERGRAQPGALSASSRTSERKRCCARVQEDGRIWVGGTTWAGRKAIRVSVSNWQTGDEEIELAVEAFRGAYAGQAPAR